MDDETYIKRNFLVIVGKYFNRTTTEETQCESKASTEIDKFSTKKFIWQEVSPSEKQSDIFVAIGTTYKHICMSC